jgi:outer membrane protein OmpA-like peptidoglycan-associated protein/tetratricopeptide (TPR) repeat protein
MKISKFLTISIIYSLLISFSSFAQEDVKIKKSKFKQQDDGFKEAWKNLKEGDKLYDEGVGAYNQALEYFSEANDYNPSNAALNYKIGVCYMLTGNDRAKAIDHLEKAYDIDKYVASDINLMLGRAYHYNMQFEKAIEQYTAYKNSLSEKDLEDVESKINKYITECKNGMELVKDPVRVIIRNLGKGVNSKYDEYNPVFHPDYTLMFFTSRRASTTKGKRHPTDYKYKEDIYKSKKMDNKWLNAQNIEEVNTKYNDAAVGLYKNGKELYIYNGDEYGGEILLSKMEEGEWTKPKKLDKPLRSKYRETTMSFSKDHKQFYFVSVREDDIESSIGGKDIYFSEINNDGEWSEPVNLGPNVNSKYDEEAVYIHPKGDTMYFSSKGHNSMGGYDVFRSHKDATGRWSKPVNLGYPINTTDDDIFYKLAKNPLEAYISTVRDEGFGGFDIYKLIYIGEEKDTKISAEDELLAWFKKPIPDLFYRKPEKLSLDSTLYMKGTITDASTEEPIVAKIQLIDKDESQVIATTLSAENGTYKMKLPDKKPYGIEVNSKGYMFFAKTINFRTENFKDNIVTKNFELEKLEVGAKMILKNIYFETAKATLKPESFDELSRVVRFLKNNPSIRIEISGHTDNVGSWNYNKKLSQERAKSVVEYIVAHDIDKSRLEYAGYSFDQPVATNETPEGRAKNRRVEFKILSTE